MGVFERDRKNQRKWEITDFTDHTDQHDRESDRSIWETFFCQLLKRLCAKAPQTQPAPRLQPRDKFCETDHAASPMRRNGKVNQSGKCVEIPHRLPRTACENIYKRIRRLSLPGADRGNFRRRANVTVANHACEGSNVALDNQNGTAGARRYPHRPRRQQRRTCPKHRADTDILHTVFSPGS